MQLMQSNCDGGQQCGGAGGPALFSPKISTMRKIMKAADWAGRLPVKIKSQKQSVPCRPALALECVKEQHLRSRRPAAAVKRQIYPNNWEDKSRFILSSHKGMVLH